MNAPVLDENGEVETITRVTTGLMRRPVRLVADHSGAVGHSSAILTTPSPT